MNCSGRSPQMSDVSEPLRSLIKNSGRSPKMSDHERFAQVGQRKQAIVSELLRSLTKNEQMSESLIFISKSLIFLSESLICSFLSKKRVIGKPMSEFPALLEMDGRVQRARVVQRTVLRHSSKNKKTIWWSLHLHYCSPPLKKKTVALSL